MLPTAKECKRRRNGTFLSSKSKSRRVLYAADETKTKNMVETDEATESFAKSKWNVEVGKAAFPLRRFKILCRYHIILKSRVTYYWKVM